MSQYYVSSTRGSPNAASKDGNADTKMIEIEAQATEPSNSALVCKIYIGSQNHNMIVLFMQLCGHQFLMQFMCVAFAFFASLISSWVSLSHLCDSILSLCQLCGLLLRVYLLQVSVCGLHLRIYAIPIQICGLHLRVCLPQV